jgi:hypothetical protein
MQANRSGLYPFMYFCFLIFILSVCVQPGFSQLTDVAQKVADALTAYGALPVTTTVQVPRPALVCHYVPPVGGVPNQDGLRPEDDNGEYDTHSIKYPCS